jgi:hypothetical protein
MLAQRDPAHPATPVTTAGPSSSRRFLFDHAQSSGANRTGGTMHVDREPRLCRPGRATASRYAVGGGPHPHMSRKLFNLAAAASLVVCCLLAWIRFENSQIRDGSFGLKYRTNPYFHRGYHSFWIADLEVSYAAGIGATCALPLTWTVTRRIRRPREVRGFEVAKRSEAAD